ncbi:MAG TPA: hypothetical protein VHD35_09995, partial [Chitinophagaceae bacterium]|nr:hypothetical protein [Chitinophagaceae bacterium]
MKKNKEQQLQKRNAELKKQLDQKKHELKIEAALEKVRVVAMRMNKPDDLLKVSETLYKQFVLLGFSEMRNAMINIHNDADRSFINYDYSDEIGKSTNHLTYNIHPLVEKQIKKIRRAKDAFSETYFTGKDLTEWKKFRKRIGEKDDPRISKSKGLYYYFYSIGIGAIGISTFSPISKEKKILLKRFRNVFNLAYQRYVDIANAEAQAKEARIETALERVRAVAMAMHQPSDLSGISETIFKELKSLGFTDLRNTEIVINNNDKETITSYYYSDYGITGVIGVDYKTNPIVKGWAEHLKKSSDAFAEIIIPEKEIKQWRKYREKLGYQPDPKLNKAKTVYHYSYSIGLGGLSISSFKIVSTEQIEILRRFRNVFQLSYQRYTDIALAEAQAREAEIELALERVRAKTMAMQKSDELLETTLVLFQQFKALGATTAQVSICIFDEEVKMGEMFVTLNGKKIDRSFIMELDKEVFVMSKVKRAFLDHQKNFSVAVTGKELQNYNRWRNLFVGKKSYDESDAVRKQSWNVNAVFFSGGVMAISSETPASDEAIKLLERFAKVFDLTFTR